MLYVRLSTLRLSTEPIGRKSSCLEHRSRVKLSAVAGRKIERSSNEEGRERIVAEQRLEERGGAHGLRFFLASRARKGTPFRT